MERTSALFWAGVLLSAITLVSCKSTPHLSFEEAREIDLNIERPTYLVPDRSNQGLLAKINTLIETENYYQTEILKKECAEIEQRIVHQTKEQIQKFSKLAWGANTIWGRGDAFAGMRKQLFDLGFFEESEGMIKPNYAGPPRVGWELNKGIMYSMRSTLSAWRKDFSAVLHWNREALENIRKSKGIIVRYGFQEDFKKILNVQNLLTKAEIAQIKGDYLKAEGLYSEVIEKGGNLYTNDPARTRELPVSLVRSRLAENLLAQNKLLAAEAEIQEALKHPGKVTAPVKSIVVTTLAQVLYEQGRFREAEEIAQAAIRLFDSACVPHRTFYFARARSVLGNVFLIQGKMLAAREQFDLIAQEHGSAYSNSFYRNFAGNLDWGIALVDSGEPARGLKQIQQANERLIQIYGADSLDASIARGYLGIAQFANDDRKSAEEAFKTSIPILIDNYLRLVGGSQKSLKEQRIRRVLEGYLEFLAIDPDTNAITASSAHISEMFEIAELARSGKVHQAVAAATARAVSDPELAELIRIEQDARRTEEALQSLIAQLSSEPGEEVAKALDEARINLKSIRSSREVVSTDIENRFPRFTKQRGIRAVSVGEARDVLRDDEALIAIYVGQKQSYIWAIRRQSEAAFAVIRQGRDSITDKVNQLRLSLDSEAETLTEIPIFDLSTAHALYRTLLEPVKWGWEGAKELVLVSHRPLGQLPLGILPMKPTALENSDNLMFSAYRKVPWLARNYAIATVPSIATFREQRSRQTLTRSTRPFIGYGDPWFSAEEVPLEEPQLAQAESSINLAVRDVRFRAPVNTRSMRSATLEHLLRLPETADELVAIAESLNANPETDVFLGLEANEQHIYNQSLDQYRVIAFATHGLVPGDLNGLRQPALAFTNPALSNIEGDGLMKLDEVLNLDLDADWVVLSACNTGASDGAGSEAISGLGRAFFYAGAKSLLVTHWPVETTSAKTLTTRIFKIKSEAPNLSRSKALQQARISVMDGPGFTDDSGRELFSYAHPIFWAPFALVGDPG